MAFELVRVFARSATRLRLFFSGPVASASTSAFVVGSQTPESPEDPPVEEALILQSSQVELVLGLPMFPGGAYQLHLLDGVVTTTFPDPPAPEAFFRVVSPGAPVPVAGQLTIQALQSNIFGDDIAWNGSDWVEGSDGDLEVVTGPENARQALTRRMISEGLLWDDTYGLKPADYVDGPAPAIPGLAAQSEVQAGADDRVKSATATVLGTNPQNPDEQLINLDLVLRDGTETSVTAPVQAA